MISIIVPVYKVENYLRQCIESILFQTYTDIEVLLIDDGSPDKCGEICDEYAKKDIRIRVFHTENRGLSEARNLGIRESEGEYVGFVDADDWIEPDMYENLFNNMNEIGSDICVCGYWHESDVTTAISEGTEGALSDSESLVALINNKITSAVWNKLYRKELFENIYFPVNMNFEDVFIMHRIFDRAKLIFVIKNPEYHYRQRGNSIKMNYAAHNLLDYAYAFLDRYYFLMERRHTIFEKEEIMILLSVANGISRVWRWWFSCSHKEKKLYMKNINEMKSFSRENFPLFGYSSWPFHLRISAFFLHSSSDISFAILYMMNQLYRKMFAHPVNFLDN